MLVKQDITKAHQRRATRVSEMFEKHRSSDGTIPILLPQAAHCKGPLDRLLTIRDPRENGLGNNR